MIRLLKLSGFLLLFCSLVFTVLYGFVVFVAMATSGSELMTQPVNWYAAVAPISYSVFCAVTIFIAQSVNVQKLLVTGLVLGSLAIPSIACSFLGYGKFLPVLMVLWAMFYYLLWKSSHNKSLNTDAGDAGAG